MKGIVYTTDGKEYEIQPNDGKHFSLEEMQHIVEGNIDIQELPKDGKLLILNDEGKLVGKLVNEKATEIWKTNYPIAEYPHNNDEENLLSKLPHLCEASTLEDNHPFYGKR